MDLQRIGDQYVERAWVDTSLVHAMAKLVNVKQSIETSFPSAIAGNMDIDIKLVEEEDQR